MEVVPWQLPISLGLFTMVVNPILIKRATGLPSRTRRMVWMFGFAACYAVLFAWIVGAPIVGTWTLAIGAIGFVNSLGAYCQWRAVDISVSRTYLFTQADDFIAMALGYFVLHEYAHLADSALLATGVAVAIAGGTAISVARYRGADGVAVPAATFPWKQLALWIAGYSVIWGFGHFAMRVFALEGVSVPSFVAAWYLGSYVGALSIRFLLGRAEAGAPLDARGIRGMLLLASTIAIALFMWTWSQSLAPITVVQPIKQVAEMVIPTMVGLIVFKEAQGLGRGVYARFAIGIAGCAIIFIVF
ncbi:MAG: hypothetical protein Q7S96_02975 [bacterium]|nr:hypothetical protein [bacterium]